MYPYHWKRLGKRTYVSNFHVEIRSCQKQEFEKFLIRRKKTMSIPFFRDRYRLFATKLIIITRSTQVYRVEIDRYFSCRWANQLFESDVKLDISNTISRFALKMVKAHLRSCVKKTYTHFVVLSSLILFVYWFVFFFSSVVSCLPMLSLMYNSRRSLMKLIC